MRSVGFFYLIGSVLAIAAVFGGCDTETGPGQDPVCVLSPERLSFGDVAVDSTTRRSFAIRNSGRGTLRAGVHVDSEEFALASGGDFELAGGESVVVVVDFRPASVGPKTCTVQTGTACGGVLCTGNGRADTLACSVSVESIDFGILEVDSSAVVSRSLTLTNTGSIPLSGEIRADSSEFSIDSGGGVFSLSPDQSRTVTVSFHPRSAGSKSCRIDLGTGCGHVNCQAIVREPEASCALDPGALDFGNVEPGDSLALSFTMTNGGGRKLSGGVAGSCQEFAISPMTYSLSPGTSQAFTVVFKPLTEGEKSCTFTLGTVCGVMPCRGVGYSSWSLRLIASVDHYGVRQLLEYRPGVLMAGGEFQHVDGLPIPHIAAWDQTQWSAFGPVLGPEAADQVNALALDQQGDLLAGGYIGGDGFVAHWNGAAWDFLGGPTPFNNTVRDVVLYDGAIVAVGKFTKVNGATARYAARWTGVQWVQLGGGVGQPANCAAVGGGQLLVAGNAGIIYLWNGSTWSTIGDLPADVNDAAVYRDSWVLALAGDEGVKMYGGGSSWIPLGYAFNAGVQALAAFQGQLYCGGNFTGYRTGGTRWDPLHHLGVYREGTGNWSPVGSDEIPTNINALAPFGSALAIGGDREIRLWSR